MDSIANLILLCSSCHTLIDKAEQDFPIELLQEWKKEHEEKIQSIFKNKKFEDLNILKFEVKNTEKMFNVQVWSLKEISPRMHFSLRPYHAENTGSRPITAVKQRRAGLVLGRVTTWEHPVL